MKRRILVGTYVLSAGYYDAYFLQAQKARRLIAENFANALSEVDVLLSPSTPSTAFKLGEKSQDPTSMYLGDIYTVAANLAGLPGISIPMGFIDGMPAGLQLLGKHFAEAQLLNCAHQYQQITAWHKAMPKQFS